MKLDWTPPQCEQSDRQHFDGEVNLSFTAVHIVNGKVESWPEVFHLPGMKLQNVQNLSKPNHQKEIEGHIE